RKYTERLRAEFVAQGNAEMDAFLVTQAEVFADLLGGRYARAEENLLALYRAAETNGSSPEMIAYARQLADCYRDWERPESALNFMEVATQLNDSIRAANKTHALVLYQTIHETREKTQEIERLEAERKIQQLRTARNRIWFLLAGLLLLFGGGFLFLRQRNQQKIREAIRIERLRNQISADLHDDVGSLLTGLSMSSEMLAYQLPPAHRAGAGQLAEMSKRAMSGMRDAVWLMNAAKDNWGNLRDRMNEFCLETLAPLDVRFSIELRGLGETETMSATVRKNLWLIFKEAITNCAKYAQAGNVSVQISSGERLIMEVTDDGVGAELPGGTGEGLANMRARAAALGGQLKVYDQDGFCIRYEGP
ncbi:MAG: histidine kinase, partial [Bacteroidota bacterium]